MTYTPGESNNSTNSSRCWDVYQEKAQPIKRISLGVISFSYPRRWSCPNNYYQSWEALDRIREEKERDLEILHLKPERRNCKLNPTLVMDL